MQRLYFSNSKEVGNILRGRPKIINFLNLYSVYLFRKEKLFSPSVKDAINFPDGKILSVLIKAKQLRGPTFTYEFLKNEGSNKKHFFIGLEKSDLNNLCSRFSNLKIKNLDSYQPPFIKGLEFAKEERNNILAKIKKFKPNYVWVCIGNPKQEILSSQLYEKHKAFYLDVGAATDFILGKKKEAPKIVQTLGLEWFYRLITDFKHSKKKVWKSFIGLFYIARVVEVRK